MQVKIFSGYRTDKIEQEINEFLKVELGEHSITPEKIIQTESSSSGNTHVTITIVY